MLQDLLQRIGKSKSTVFFVADDVLPQTLEVVRTRAEPIGVQVVTGPAADAAKHDAFGVLLQYPGVNGDVADYRAIADAVRGQFFRIDLHAHRVFGRALHLHL